MTATLSRRDRPSVRQDAATRRWVKRAWLPEVTPSRSQLLTYAQTRIATLTDADAPGRSIGWAPVHSAIANLAMSLLNIVVASDGLATPQIAPTPDGGLDIQWLVSGDSLELTLDFEDCLSIVGRCDNGEYVFGPYEWDFQDDVDTLVPILVSAGRFLEKISTGIQHRLPIR